MTTNHPRLLTKAFGENREAAFEFYWAMYNAGHDVEATPRFDRATRIETWTVAYSETPVRNGPMPIDELAAREMSRVNLKYL